MKSKIITLLLMMSCFMCSYSQRNYPIQTIFKGDSVVMLTINQSDKINKLIDSQELTIQDKLSEIKILEKYNTKLKDTIKNLNLTIKNMNSTIKDINYNYEQNKTYLEKNIKYAKDSLSMQIKEKEKYKKEKEEMEIELNSRIKEHRVTSTLLLVATGIFTAVVTIFSGK